MYVSNSKSNLAFRNFPINKLSQSIMFMIFAFMNMAKNYVSTWYQLIVILYTKNTKLTLRIVIKYIIQKYFIELGIYQYILKVIFRAYLFLTAHIHTRKQSSSPTSHKNSQEDSSVEESSSIISQGQGLNQLENTYFIIFYSTCFVEMILTTDIQVWL